MAKTIVELRSTLEHLYKIGNREQIEAFFTDEILDHIPGCCTIDDEYIYLMNEGGSYYRGISDYEKSISMFTELLRNMERFHLGQSLGAANVLNNLAGSYRMSGNCEKAEDLFQQAIRVYEDLAYQGTYEYASVWNNLSLCYQASGKTERALRAQLCAIELLSELENVNPVILATSYANVAAIFQKLEQTDLAFDAIQKSVALFEENGRTGEPAYTGALHTRASLFYAVGDCEKAADDYHKVMEFTTKFFGKNADYAIAARNLALTLRKQGQIQEGLPYLRESVELDRVLFGENSPRYIKACSVLQQFENEVSK